MRVGLLRDPLEDALNAELRPRGLWFVEEIAATGGGQTRRRWWSGSSVDTRAGSAPRGASHRRGEQPAMRDFKPVFRELEARLRHARWFADGWETSSRGAYLQLYREDWHNDGHGGIHFETSLEGPEIAAKSVPVALHAEEETPRPELLVPALRSRVEPVVAGWKGWEVPRHGMILCRRRLPLDARGIGERLFEELVRPKQLAPLVDEELARER
jgi:hypothetical protein